MASRWNRSPSARARAQATENATLSGSASALLASASQPLTVSSSTSHSAQACRKNHPWRRNPHSFSCSSGVSLLGLPAMILCSAGRLIHHVAPCLLGRVLRPARLGLLGLACPLQLGGLVALVALRHRRCRRLVGGHGAGSVWSAAVKVMFRHYQTASGPVATLGLEPRCRARLVGSLCSVVGLRGVHPLPCENGASRFELLPIDRGMSCPVASWRHIFYPEVLFRLCDALRQ